MKELIMSCSIHLESPIEVSLTGLLEKRRDYSLAYMRHIEKLNRAHGKTILSVNEIAFTAIEGGTLPPQFSSFCNAILHGKIQQIQALLPALITNKNCREIIEKGTRFLVAFNGELLKYEITAMVLSILSGCQNTINFMLEQISLADRWNCISRTDFLLEADQKKNIHNLVAHRFLERKGDFDELATKFAVWELSQEDICQLMENVICRIRRIINSILVTQDLSMIVIDYLGISSFDMVVAVSEYRLSDIPMEDLFPKVQIQNATPLRHNIIADQIDAFEKNHPSIARDYYSNKFFLLSLEHQKFCVTSLKTFLNERITYVTGLSQCEVKIIIEYLGLKDDARSFLEYYHQKYLL